MSTSKTIVLKSSDGETFEVEAAVAMESQTIKHLIDANCIPLPNVTSKILFKVIEYCKRHVDAHKSSEDDLKKFDEEFVKVDDNTLFDLILAANYLNIGSLLDLTRQTVADMIKGKNPDEIKKIFSVKNDFKVLMATSSDRQENVGDNRQPESSVEIKDKFRRYIPLVKATLEGDWDFAGGFFGQEGGALTASLTKFSETALHIVVGTGKAIHFLEELVRSMPVQALEARDRRGDTALHTAARVGNTAAAVILAEKHQPLLYMPTKCCMLPVHVAALTGSKDTLSYLLEVTMDDPNAKPYHDESGIGLLTSVITSGFYDIALKLIDRYPHLATLKNSSGDCALGNIAMKVSAFPSGSRLNLWERIIYSYVPVKLENNSENQNGGDIENQRRSAPFWGANFSIFGHAVSQKLQAFFWKVLELSVPQIKHVQEQKHMHLQALQLVKCLCEKIQSLDDSIDY